jgi:hypothetical protein
MAALTVAAFTTLVIDVLGDGRSPLALPPAVAFGHILMFPAMLIPMLRRRQSAAAHH